MHGEASTKGRSFGLRSAGGAAGAGVHATNCNIMHQHAPFARSSNATAGT